VFVSISESFEKGFFSLLDFTPWFEKNNYHVITSLWTIDRWLQGEQSLLTQTRQCSTYTEWISMIFTSRRISHPQNTFPEFFLNIILITSIGRHLDCRRQCYFRTFVMIASSNSFIACSTLQILWSACSQQTCDQAIIFFKPWSKINSPWSRPEETPISKDRWDG